METHNVVSTNEEAFPKLPTANYICSGSAEQHTTQSQSSSQTVWFTKGTSSLVQGCSNHVPQKPTAPTENVSNTSEPVNPHANRVVSPSHTPADPADVGNGTTGAIVHLGRTPMNNNAHEEKSCAPANGETHDEDTTHNWMRWETI